MLKIDKLSFRYNPKGEDVISDFSIELDEGSILAVLGSSGSGKSTLLRIISGLEERGKGDIFIAGKSVQGKDVFMPVEKRKVGFVFQDYALFPFMTVEKNIYFGMEKKDPKRLNEVIRLTHLEGLEKRYPHQLSGGQQQRVALARTLASDPKILLMDEPFSNLDAELVDGMRKEIKEIIRNQKITTVIVTHNKEDADYLADKTVFMD
ncbi:MAG TPA: ABC transporter [Eubacteriaceae bacterium]|nr:ABC transporter [Eubacteriaceae bacterium]